MQDSSIQEKRIILIILGLLILSVILSGIKRYYPDSADSIIYIKPNSTSSAKPFSSKRKADSLGLINVNSAAIADLVELSGIGQVIAERIIAYRNSHGAFKTKEDLLNIKGIGVKKLEKIQDQIILE